MSKSRQYCYTLNNYTEDDYNRFKDIPCVYHVIGKEIAPTTNTPHLQGFIYFQNPLGVKSVRKLLAPAHVEICKGTIDQNIDYCMKSDNYIQIGEKPVRGKRNDIIRIKQMVQDFQSMSSIIQEATSYQSIKCAELLKKYIDRKRSEKTIVVWLYGPSGCGKSKLINELFPDAYWCMPTGRWFDGYDGDECVIIDDIRNTFMPFNSLLNLFDRYPFRVESKGGSRQFVSRYIGVTCPFHPKELYKHIEEDIGQLLRRIEIIVNLDNLIEKETFLASMSKANTTLYFERH